MAPSSTGTEPQSISGRTVNAVTGMPVGRVLIHCGTSAMLTDYEGKFKCDVDGASVSITATKPGYFLSVDPSESSSLTLQAPFPDTPPEIRLYPEALLTGTVTAPNGESLQGISVQARRSLYDELGHHWTPAGTTRTDAHGVFRLPVSAGEYILQSLYSVPNSTRSQAVLPVTLPGEGSSNDRDTIQTRSGETQHIDLHPALAQTFVVTARLEPDSGRGDLRVAAVGAAGGEITLRSTPTSTPGEIRMDVPSGSYLLQATQQMPEGLQTAETRINVGDHDLGGVVLQFSTAASIPITLQAETSPTSDTSTPSLSDFGLSLQRVQTTALTPGEDSERPIMHGNRPPFFNPSPGSYRLRARSGGTWFVRSASYGTGDLLRQNLVVVRGSGSVSLRIVASNQTASIGGILRSSGRPIAGWIYLISTTPSATPLIIVHANSDGTYIRSAVPPGSYRAIAFEHRHALNFEDSDTLVSLSNDLRAITLNFGEKNTVNLELTPFPESH